MLLVYLRLLDLVCILIVLLIKYHSCSYQNLTHAAGLYTRSGIDGFIASFTCNVMLSCNAMSCHTMQCHVMQRSVMSCHAKSLYTVFVQSYLEVSCSLGRFLRSGVTCTHEFLPNELCFMFILFTRCLCCMIMHVHISCQLHAAI